MVFEAYVWLISIWKKSAFRKKINLPYFSSNMSATVHATLKNQCLSRNVLCVCNMLSFCPYMFELFSLDCVVLSSDLGHSGERSVGWHDGQREAAALVPAHGGGIPRPALRQLHHQLERRQALQRHYPQTQVSNRQPPVGLMLKMEAWCIFFVLF